MKMGKRRGSELALGLELGTLREEIREAVAILRAYGAKRVILFGSAARSSDGAELRPRDLDLACEGLPPDRFFAALGRLLAMLSVPVDLVDLRGAGLRRSIRERISREGVLLYEAE